MSRDKVIIRTSVIGILANVMLAAFKAVIGLLSIPAVRCAIWTAGWMISRWTAGLWDAEHV